MNFAIMNFASMDNIFFSNVDNHPYSRSSDLVIVCGLRFIDIAETVVF